MMTRSPANRDFARGGDPLAHDRSRDIRLHSTQQRELSASARVDIATQRDAGAHQRDLAALARDQAADARDLAMAQRDVYELQDGLRAVTAAELVLRAADRRKRAAQDRVLAAENRVLAAQDRRSAREDREQAARDRRQAFADREAFVAALLAAETDELTGAQTRAAGLRRLDSELDRCRRSNGELVACYLDVVGLKAVNDSQGHGAGDDAPTATCSPTATPQGAMTINSQLRRASDLHRRTGGPRSARTCRPCLNPCGAGSRPSRRDRLSHGCIRPRVSR